MDKRSFEKLEFDKILEMLSNNMVLESNKKRALLLEPYSDLNELSSALDEVLSAQSLILRRGNPPINDVDNVALHLKRLEINALLHQKELLDIAGLLRNVRLLQDYAKEDCELSGYFEGLIVLKKLEDDITTKILSEDEIADNASIKLYTIRKKIAATHDKIREILNKIITSQSYQKFLQESLITMRGDRFVIPVKAEHRNDIAGIVHDSSASGSTVFIEPMAVVEANNSLKQLFNDEAKEIERILYELSSMAALHTQEILTDYNIIGSLDFIFGKAKLSVGMKAVKPIVNDRGYINLKKARHPLIDSQKVVPIDIELGKEFDTLVITGPNTGGKTVTLKTVGLLCLMGLSGLLIPAFDKSEISYFSEIYADIGDEQSISQSLSTFSSHMTNIVNIINSADYNSLVLLDELGAGTDPVEGASLAIGIIEYLRSRGAKILATTHYSELKLFALSNKGVKNASCEFDVETLRPTYRLLIGVPGKSNAFAISKKLGLNEDVLNKAKSHLNEDNIKFEDVLAEIEKNRILLKKECELTNKFKNEADELKNKLLKEKEQSEEKYRKIINDANLKAKEILEDAKQTADEIIKELRETRKNEAQREFDRKTFKAKELLSQKIKSKSKDIIGNKQTHKRINPDELLIGATVRLVEYDQTATVLTKPDKNGDLTVMAGILKIKVNISDIIIDENENNKEIDYVTFKKNELKNKQVSTEIDLRGQTVTDGVMDAEKFIDDAVMLKLERISIIHGKGTGVLRAAIHQMLKKNKQVKSYRLGKFGEGEDGVTIVYLQ